jgi:hypothetical protein
MDDWTAVRPSGSLLETFAQTFVNHVLRLTLTIELGYLDWSARRRIRRHLSDLTGSERNLLRRCWLNNGAAIPVVHDLGTARSLEKKGILWQSAERLDRPDFNITDSAYRVLREPEFSEMFVP